MRRIATNPLGVMGLLGVAVIVASVAFPDAIPWVGALGLLLLLVSILGWMIVGSRGDSSDERPRGVSRYELRPKVTALPAAALLALASWEILLVVPTGDPSVPAVAVVAVIAGVVWGFLRRIDATAGVTKFVVGAVAVGLSMFGLLTGSECYEPLPAWAAIGLVVVVLGLLTVAAMTWVLKKAVLKPTGGGAYVLGLVGLLVVVQFAVAPIGRELLTGTHGLLILTGVVALVLITVAGIWNPELMEALVGTGVVVGALYLAFAGVSLGVDPDLLCRSFAQQLLFVGAFTLAAVIVGGSLHRRGDDRSGWLG